MPHVHVQVIFPYFTGLPRDVAINTFNFRVDALDLSTLDSVGGRLNEFYNDAAGASQTLAQHMGLSITRNACKFKYYEIPTAYGPMGDPIREDTWTLDPAGTGIYPLPMEVAACCSMVGADASASSIPIRRRRGRIYLGPLNSLAIDTTLDNFPNLSTATRTNLAERANNLVGDNGVEGVDWVVWSRAGWAAGAGADAFQTVRYGWVDNEFDTQRRREMDSTARTAWGTPPV